MFYYKTLKVMNQHFHMFCIQLLLWAPTAPESGLTCLTHHITELNNIQYMLTDVCYPYSETTRTVSYVSTLLKNQQEHRSMYHAYFI